MAREARELCSPPWVHRLDIIQTVYVEAVDTVDTEGYIGPVSTARFEEIEIL